MGSLFFYAWGEAANLPILLLSVLCNYFLGLHLGQGRKSTHKKRCILIVGLMANLVSLILFKAGVGDAGLPLGISFYTFQMMAYLIDTYRGENKRERSLLKFATYICMFPQLTAGPIVRYGEVRDALAERKITPEQIQDGLGTFVMGLSYKVLLADRIGILWHEVQVTGFESISTPLAWVAAIAYSMKIYFDFYGYSLMAIGLGRMLGFSLPENFQTPYMARSVRDFYRRWHMTLGRWFCNYVYIPLGGNRRGELRTIGNLLVVWLLTAVWHGGTLNFLIWGGLLVACIIVERLIGRISFVKRLKILPHLYLWTVIPITWMCFANTELSQLGLYLGKMFGMDGAMPGISGDWVKALWNYRYLFAVGAVCCTDVVHKIYVKGKNTLMGKLLLAVLLWWCVERLLEAGNNPFLYFSF